jgi:rhodanese-related sulfurtransferase
MAKHSLRFETLVNEVRPRVRETTVADVRAHHAAGRPFLLIDVREDHEWSAGRLPGATHLGRGILERDIEKLIPDLDTPMILYCGGGYRSALAVDSLQKMGYTQVESLAGGFRAWREAGGDIVGEDSSRS